jgi:hypothetical protein
MAFGQGVVDGSRELQTCTLVCGVGLVGSTPYGVAVDQSTHDVYVVEGYGVQKFAFDQLTEKFEFLLSYGGGVLAGGATGAGDLTAGSNEVTNVTTSSRHFIVGQALSGSGIPAGTRIAGLVYSDEEPGKIILTQSAAATAKSVALTAPTPPANNPNNEVQEVALGGSPTGGIFTLDGIGGEFTATTVSGSPDVSSASAVVGGGVLTAGSNVVVILAQTVGAVRVGQTIAGPGIPSGTTVTSLESDGSTNPTMSANATLTTSGGVSVNTHGTGDLASGSNTVTAVSNVGAFVVGWSIVGAGIPAGTTIEAVNEAEAKLTLSAKATASGSAIALTSATRPQLTVGEGVVGHGIPAGATVTSVGPNGEFTLSANATASASGADLESGVPFNVSAGTFRSLFESIHGTGNFEVTGPAGGPWQVEFKGRYADTNVTPMNGVGSGLLPSAQVQIKTVVEGASDFETCTEADISEGYPCLQGVPGSGPGQVVRETPIAVDSATHDVWAVGSNGLEQYGEDGEYLSEVKLPDTDNVALAVDSAGDFYTLTAPSGEENEGQEVTVPVTGTFTLTFEGDTTTPIQGPINGKTPLVRETMQKALEELPSIGPGNVKVSVGNNDYIYVIEATPMSNR